MSIPPLTRTERRLVREIKTLASDLGLDPVEIAEEEDQELRYVGLTNARMHIIRGEVITQFTLVDDLLTHELTIEILGGSKKKPWRRKKVRFDRAKAVLIESRMSLRHKLDLYKTYRRVPARIVEIVAGLNSARNSLAHVFYLEGRRRRAKYRGQDIISVKTFDRFREDMQYLYDYLLRL